MSPGDRIHRLNLLCAASLTDDELRVAMREVDKENPNEMYNQVKELLKKYYGSSSIFNQTNPANIDLFKVNQRNTRKSCVQSKQ